ncbi:MAG TPA: type II toxin-antitoxin system HicA family toxin [Phycisphaerae bacterium]|nr:type II toxin-antitoxin system HicA family toxin [Phycisphaerae bacterium]
MKAVTGKQLAAGLERHAWQLMRVSGSHHIYGKPGNVVRLSVPIHAGRTLKTGLLKHLLKMAGLGEQDLKT